MSFTVGFRPEAVADVVEARGWYEEQEPGLGEGFAESLEEIIDRILSMPRMYPVVDGGIRRGKLRKFPYLIYYRVVADRIEVLAVLHGSRDPKLTRARIN